MKRYILHSTKDISPRKLAQLYNVSYDLCLLVESLSLHLRTCPKFICLFPRPSGDYQEWLERVLQLRQKELD